MTAYDARQFEPPAPIARVKLRNPDTEYEMIAFDGTRTRSLMVQLDIIFCRRNFHGQFLLINETYGIIGRNVLNSVPLLLDGPNLMWDEYRPAR